MAQNPANKPAYCEWCPQEWKMDPNLLVACPRCKAAPKSPCMRPSEHAAWDFHPERQHAAQAAGIIDHRCQGLCGPGQQSTRQQQAVLVYLRKQYPDRDIISWEATYAAVDYVLAHPHLWGGKEPKKPVAWQPKRITRQTKTVMSTATQLVLL